MEQNNKEVKRVIWSDFLSSFEGDAAAGAFVGKWIAGLLVGSLVLISVVMVVLVIINFLMGGIIEPSSLQVPVRP